MHEEDQGFCTTCGTDLNEEELYFKITAQDKFNEYTDEPHCRDCLVDSVTDGVFDD